MRGPGKFKVGKSGDLEFRCDTHSLRHIYGTVHGVRKFAVITKD